MSWDLEVVVARKPSAAILRTNQSTIAVDGPDAVESEDLAPSLANLVVGGWLVRIMVASSAQAARVKARQLAERIAKECKGVVYDPQEDAVVWPAQPLVSTSRQAKAKPAPKSPVAAPELQVSWLVAGRPDSTCALKWLTAVDDLYPLARPTRYGPSEPLQHRLSDDPAGFLVAWERTRQVDFGSNLFWKTATKDLWGSVTMPEWRKSMPNGTPISRQGSPVTRLDLHVPPKIISTPRERQALADFFVETAKRLDAVFAAAWSKKEGSYTQGDTGTYIPAATPLKIERYGHWQGTNNEPAWLFWLGLELQAKYRVGPLLGQADSWTERPLPHREGRESGFLQRLKHRFQGDKTA